MKVSIAVHVFGDADFEINDVDDIPTGLREYADRGSDHLRDAAKIADTLVADGWVVRLSRNNLEASHPNVGTFSEAQERVGRLGIADQVTDIGVFDDRGRRQTHICGS